MKTEGNATPYSGASTHRPLPQPDLSHRMSPPATSWTCPTEGCGFTARKQTFHLCAVADPNAKKSRRSKFAPAREFTDEELEKRFTAPTDRPEEAAMEISQNQTAAPTPAPSVRAKVAQAGPDDVVITLRGTGIAARTTEVSALLADLLTGLRGTPAAAVPEPVVRTKPSRSKLAEHHDAVLAAYAEGQTPYEIGQAYQTTDTAVRNYLTGSGIKLRTRREAQLARHSRAAGATEGKS